MRKILDGSTLTLGVCYYPEHWPQDMWAADLDRMSECGIRVVRIAEFSWNLTEPSEGVFTYDFYDRFLDLCQEKGMKVIFGTPTATPPAWLTKRYPEVLNAHADGTPLEHGGRRHYNYNAPVYREKAALIVEKLASHFGRHPAVIGWQIDNELNCEVDEFYSAADACAFRIFLREKYGTLEELNRAWGTVFWNQTYTDWEEISLPKRARSGNPNPHALLDYARFISHSACGFARMQSEILRKYLKEGDFITTNGRFDHLDNHRMTRESLDFYTYDSYPDMAYNVDGGRLPSGLRDREASRSLSEVRSISPVFGIMEQQSGPNGWTTCMAAPAPKPGQMTLWTMQSIAHGADYISYFRWRTCTFGTEMYWHGILDYSGRENRRMAELRSIHRKLEAIQEVAGGCYRAQVGVLKDYDNCWDLRIDMWHRDLENVSQPAIFAAAQKTHTPEEPAEVLGVYENCYYAGEGALLRHRCRKGVVYSLGTVFTEELTAALLEEVQAAEPERETMVLPECCELAVREKDGKKYYFVLNYSADQVTILLKRSLVSLFDGVSVEGEVALEPYGTAVLM